MTTVRVNLAERAYDVIVGSGLLADAGERIAGLPNPGKRCAIITEETVAPLYAQKLEKSLQNAGFRVETITVPAGEASKSMNVVSYVCREMLKHGLDRKSFVVALGGGVIGDLAGFCAAIFQRGVPLVQIPTTVLSQVDSSVGGKTGVNTPEGKNLLGAFHQPQLVLADVETLESLPDREFREGFAEIIKHAAIRDAEMLDEIEKQGPSRDGLAPLIARNVAIKAAVVEEDERETSDTRALLNFGHTIGHGVEAAAGYGQLLHGEAVSIGMTAALRVSEQIAGLPKKSSQQVEALLAQFKLPRCLDGTFQTRQILEILQRDKKFAAGAVRFVLLRALGDAYVSDEVTLEQIEREIDALIVV